MMQITAAVEPGSDGGPLLDMSGNVVGVLISSLNPLHPSNPAQNVSFALKASLARELLDRAGVRYQSAPSIDTVDSAAIGEAAKRSAVVVECW